MAYINGTGIISPQKTAGTSDFLTEITEHNTEFLKCIEPNYKEFIDPLAARRMSRLIKMGITSALMCIRDAGISEPDAIITGTGLGSVEDTEKILSSIHDENTIFYPTPFIQSTYNTISSQIAIILKCHNYNSTYVHRIFSFESTLQDALMQIEEGTAQNILAGGIDEMTLNHLHIIRRLGDLKQEPESNLRLLEYRTPGTLAGEGSSYFVLSKNKNDHSYARLQGVKTIFHPTDKKELEANITG
ncbi:MAG: beta-ketoacyl synthase chain length factor, partial [Bacteroidota bacterium]|nr:beta-ketoacyl synthase chain length factor [Bacteroidota bacterium]